VQRGGQRFTVAGLRQFFVEPGDADGGRSNFHADDHDHGIEQCDDSSFEICLRGMAADFWLFNRGNEFCFLPLAAEEDSRLHDDGDGDDQPFPDASLRGKQQRRRRLLRLHSGGELYGYGYRYRGRLCQNYAERHNQPDGELIEQETGKPPLVSVVDQF
jgi:hypothetical protein